MLYHNLFLNVRKSNNFKRRSGMFDAYVLVDIVRLLTLHATVGTLKSRWTTAFESTMSQHVMHVLIALMTFWACVPNNKFIFYVINKKLTNKNLLIIYQRINISFY